MVENIPGWAQLLGLLAFIATSLSILWKLVAKPGWGLFRKAESKSRKLETLLEETAPKLEKLTPMLERLLPELEKALPLIQVLVKEFEDNPTALSKLNEMQSQFFTDHGKTLKDQTDRLEDAAIKQGGISDAIQGTVNDLKEQVKRMEGKDTKVAVDLAEKETRK